MGFATFRHTASLGVFPFQHGIAPPTLCSSFTLNIVEGHGQLGQIFCSFCNEVGLNRLRHSRECIVAHGSMHASGCNCQLLWVAWKMGDECYELT